MGSNSIGFFKTLITVFFVYFISLLFYLDVEFGGFEGGFSADFLFRIFTAAITYAALKHYGLGYAFIAIAILFIIGLFIMINMEYVFRSVIMYKGFFLTELGGIFLFYYLVEKKIHKVKYLVYPLSMAVIKVVIGLLLLPVTVLLISGLSVSFDEFLYTVINNAKFLFFYGLFLGIAILIDSYIKIDKQNSIPQN